jgi:hypothetical protein
VLSASLSMRSESNASSPVLSPVSVETASLHEASGGQRDLLRYQILERLEHSLWEGELPEHADIQAVSCLCMSLASGLGVCLQDGISKTWLENSIHQFVESVGFHKVPAPKRRARNTLPAPALRLVKGNGKSAGQAELPSGDGSLCPNHEGFISGSQPLQQIDESEPVFTRKDADRILHGA